MKNRLELKLEEQKQHDKDIIKYVQDKLRVRDKEITQNILERADHVFLWVVLVVEMLNQAFDCGKISAMKRKLQEVASDLDGIFYVLLQKDNSDTRATLLMFQWVLFAIRPLSPIELYFGVIAGTEPEELGAWKPQYQSLEVIERYITNISRGLIEVRKGKGIVAQFIHQSVNDFLLRNKRLQTLDHTLRRHMVGASHDRLVACCMAYITTKALDLYANEELLEEMRIMRRGYQGFTEIHAREFPFLRYAAKYVLRHAEMARAESISQLAFVQQLQHGNFQRLKTFRNTFVDYFFDHEKYTESLLYVVSLNGYIELAKIILQDPATSVKRDASYIGNALQAASFYGHYKIVELLLEMGAEVNQEGGEYGSALHAAIYNRHSEVAALLLEKGADVDLNVGRCGTALYAASSWNRVDAVVLLLEKGAEINVQGGEYGTALHAASYNGHEETIVLLLEKGADINLGGGKYGAALHAASHLALKDTVALLLENGADVNLPDGNHGTALHAASTWGCKEVVSLLLEKGARVNLQAGRYSTALQAASYRGSEEIVALLLKKGADVNIQGGDFGNALQAALVRGHQKIVTLLRNHGAIE